MTSEDRENERQENEALKSAQEIVKKKTKNKVRKIIMHAVTAVVIPMLISLVKIFAVAIIVMSILAVFQSVLDDSDYDDVLQGQPQGYSQASRISSLREYLRQFSLGDNQSSPQSADGRFYKMYDDGAGWPTIGDEDLQWKSVQEEFNCPGLVLDNGVERNVPSVMEYVNSLMTRGSNATYSKAEIENMNIYVEKGLVEKAAEKLQQEKYNLVVRNTEGLNLSQQQLYALTSIAYNFGHLPKRPNDTKTFKEVYLDGAKLYEINSWEHNRYIWDNWWCYLGGGYAGHIPCRDAAFETYVKGVYKFAQADSGGVFEGERRYYIYYTQDQLALFSYAPKSIPITRNISDTANEIKIFSYNEVNLTVASASAEEVFEVCKGVMNDLIANEIHYGHPATGDIKKTNDFTQNNVCNCATFVSVVLYRAGLLEESFINKYEYGYTGSNGVGQMLDDAGWKRVTKEELQPGDICLYPPAGGQYGHVWIYAGGDDVWDQHCGVISSNGDDPTCGTVPWSKSYISKAEERGGLQAWRIP